MIIVIFLLAALAGELQACDVSAWPDVKGGKVCGSCKVLVKNMAAHSTCDKYCGSFGRTCTGAWEDEANSCRVKSTENCQHKFGGYTSDAICECGNESGLCKTSSWPNVKSGKVCGSCKVLAKNMAAYSTCEKYCSSFGRTCTGAWEDEANSCRVKSTENCQHKFGRYTSDAICECGNQPGGNQPGGNQPGGNQPGGNQPGGNQPGGNQPSSGYCNIGSGQAKGQLPSSVKESSGLAFSTRNPGTLYTHNDSEGKATIFALSKSGQLTAEINLEGVKNIDWEAMAVAGNKIYIGDVGNNGKKRTNLRILRLNEPDISGSSINIPKSQVTELKVEYRDRNYDCEGLVVDPSTKDLFLFTKQGSRTRVYKYPNVETAQGSASRFQLEFVTELPIKEVTGADLSPDGNTLVLTTYYHGYSLTKPAGVSWTSFLKSDAHSFCELDIRKRGGMEAVAVAEDGIWTSNECNECDLYFFPKL